MELELVLQFIRSIKNEDGEDVVLGLRRKNTRECVMFTIGQDDAAPFVDAFSTDQHGDPVLHVAFTSVMQESGITLERYVLTEVDDTDTLRGSLVLRIREQLLSVPCRPNDGVLLATLTKAPILITEDLFVRMQPQDIPESSEATAPPNDAGSSEWSTFFARQNDLPKA